MSKTLIAVAVLGKRNLTRITHPRPLSPLQLNTFAIVVSKKDPAKTYYVVEIGKNKLQRKKDVLYAWHVGDGFTHAEGWWVEVG